MFTALCKRRNVRLKHDRFANALTASAVYNVNRTTADSPVLTAFDFVRETANEAEEQTKAIKGTIRQIVGNMPSNLPREKFQAIRARTIESLTAQGRTDAESLFDEVWPGLKPATKE
jgi:hypothetical protein